MRLKSWEQGLRIQGLPCRVFNFRAWRLGFRLESSEFAAVTTANPITHASHNKLVHALVGNILIKMFNVHTLFSRVKNILDPGL